LLFGLTTLELKSLLVPRILRYLLAIGQAYSLPIVFWELLG